MYNYKIPYVCAICSPWIKASISTDPGASISTDPGASISTDPGASISTDPGASISTDTGASISTDTCAATAEAIDPGRCQSTIHSRTQQRHRLKKCTHLSKLTLVVDNNLKEPLI
jgi:hypothetical protein